MERRNGSKRKARDDKILCKARKHIENPLGDDEGDEDSMVPPFVTDEEIQNALNPPNLEGPPVLKKLRKPRHSSEERKAKASLLQEVAPAKKNKKKQKKKRRNKRCIEVKSMKDLDSKKRRTSHALEFLQNWKEKRSEWKFEKLKQCWLLSNCCDSESIPDSFFPVLLEYLSSVGGHARLSTEKAMLDLMNGLGEKECLTEKETGQYERARAVVQMLSE